MNVAVLGAGVVGVTTAWYLARHGHEVTVIDRQPEAALETSFANGGQIAVSHAEPWANPHTPLKALKWLGREDAPLLFRLRPDPHLLCWTLRFLRECTPWRTRKNIRQIVALADYSRQCLRALRSELATAGGLHYDHLARGILHVYTDEREFESAIKAADILRDFGCDRRTVSPSECIRIEPALAGARSLLVGGDFNPEDESGDAHRFTQTLANHCARAGVTFRMGVGIDRLTREAGQITSVLMSTGEHLQADAYVVALGSYSAPLLRPLGIHLPIYPAKGYSATVQLSSESIAPTTSLTDDEHKLVFSRLGNRLRIAGTAEFTGFDLSLNPTRCKALLQRTRTLFPSLRETGAPEYWCGLRPVTPSSVPHLGRSRIQNLWLNTGHGTLGWTMACGSAALLSDMLHANAP